MNVTELTTAAGWIAGLAIVALIASGWRKPARAEANRAHVHMQGGKPDRLARNDKAHLVEEKVPLAQRTPLWRRVWAVVASGGLALWVAAVIATVIAFGGAWIVITLTDLLKQ